VQLETMHSERDGWVATIVLNRPHVLNCANEQWARNLNTVVDDHFYPEVIDPETGDVLPDGERGELVFTSLTKEALLRQAQLTPHYVLEVSREGTLDQLTVKVEPHRDVANQRVACQRAATDLQRQIKSYIGVTAFVVICDPGTVERSMGKAKRVIDARSHQ